MKTLQTTLVSIFIIGLFSSAQAAYTCTCKGTHIEQQGQQLIYSGGCHIVNVKSDIPQGTAFKQVEFNNRGPYQRDKALKSFISQRSLINNLNESKEPIASVYDHRTGFSCEGVPALRLQPHFFDVFHLF